MRVALVTAAAVVLSAAVLLTAEAKPIHYKRWGAPNLDLPVHDTAGRNVTLDSFNQAEAYRFLLYSYAAYLTGGIVPWTCAYCKYTSAVSSFQSYATMYDSGTDAFGYIGYNPQFNEIVISFRGSSSLTNWILNLQFYKSQTPFGGGSGGVATGFYAFWTALRPQVTSNLAALVQAHPTAQIYTTGHSLGAAASSLAAVDLMVNYGYNNILVRNYGEPRVGDGTYANFANGVVGQYMRMTHNDDIVVHLPPEDFNFQHETQEIWETSGGYTACSTSNGEDGNCADSVEFWDFSVSDHLSYMGVSCCGGPSAGIKLPEDLTAKEKGY